MIAFLIRFISLFKWLYNWMGVDFQQMKTIVATKLLMDNRRHVVGATSQKDGNVNSSFIGVMVIYGIFGLFFSYIIYVIPSFIISMTIYHSYLIVMVSLTLVSDFSSVLLDTSDNTIILPRPVSSKTLLAARVTHIVIYLTQITIALSLGALVATFIKFGWVIGFLLMITTILSLLFALILTNGLYLALMRFTSEEKLKNIINYFQIAMTFLMMGAYQILPRLMSKDFLADSGFVLTWWAALVPPMWMAGLLDIFYSATIDSVHVVCALFAIGFSVVAAFLMSKFFSSTFNEKLADLGTTNVAVEPKQNRSGFLLGLRNIITKQGIERASFDLVSAALARDRKLKLKIYPSIGSIVILALVVIFNGKDSFQATLNNLSNLSAHIFLIYSVFLVIQTIMTQVCISDYFKAGWVFNAAPINKPGLILLGSWKAVLASFFVPIYGVISVFVVLIWKTNGIDDLIFGLAANIFVTLITIIVSSKHFPLSLEPNAKNQAGNFVKVILIMMIIGAIGFGHYLLTKIEYGLWISFPLIIGLTYFCYAKVKATIWSQIDLG
jgi:ABC-2 type transport system permease protein